MLKRTRRAIQYFETSEGERSEMFEAVCKLGLEGIVLKKKGSQKSAPACWNELGTVGDFKSNDRCAYIDAVADHQNW